MKFVESDAKKKKKEDQYYYHQMKNVIVPICYVLFVDLFKYICNINIKVDDLTIENFIRIADEKFQEMCSVE